LYPEALVNVSSYKPPELTVPIQRFNLTYKAENPAFAPIKYVADIKKADPLSSIVQAMGGLREGERIIYTLHVDGMMPDMARKKLREEITRSSINPFHFFSYVGIGMVLGQVASGNTRAPKFIPEDHKIFETRLLSHSFYNVYLLVQIDMLDDEFTRGRVVNMSTIIHNQVATKYNFLIPLELKRQAQGEVLRTLSVSSPQAEKATNAANLIDTWVTRRKSGYSSARFFLSTWELATLWHLPHEEFTSTEIVWSPGRQVPVPRELAKSSEGVLLGYNLFAGRKVPIWLPDKDRDTHMSIVGKTKVGKSTFMHNLIHQDIRAGKGVAVIDPHGALVRDILRNSIPNERINDVVVLDIANDENPPPLNPLTVPEGVAPGNAAGRLLSVLDKIYGGLSNTPRISETLSSVLTTLLLDDTPTVRDVGRLFDDANYRSKLLGRLTDIPAEEFWYWFEKQSPGQQEQIAYPVVYRMRSFYGNPSLYPMMCHPNALDFTRLINQGKIILVSLHADEEKIPSSARELLGAVLVSQLQMAAMRSVKDKQPFYLYVDEAQNFITTALNKMLSEVRKFGLYLILANQFLDQLKGPVLSAVLGNVGASIAFQVGPDDARALSPYFKPEFSQEDLINLDLYRAGVKVRLGGQNMPAFSLETLKPVAEPEDADRREALIRRRSVELYTPRTQKEVLDWLRRRYPKPEGYTGRGESGPGDGDWVVTPE